MLISRSPVRMKNMYSTLSSSDSGVSSKEILIISFPDGKKSPAWRDANDDGENHRAPDGLPCSGDIPRTDVLTDEGHGHAARRRIAGIKIIELIFYSLLGRRRPLPVEGKDNRVQNQKTDRGERLTDGGPARTHLKSRCD